jgi:hypothetical protein
MTYPPVRRLQWLRHIYRHHYGEGPSLDVNVLPFNIAYNRWPIEKPTQLEEGLTGAYRTGTARSKCKRRGPGTWLKTH